MTTLDLRVARAYLMTLTDSPTPCLAQLVAQSGPVAAATAILGDDIPATVRSEISHHMRVEQAEDALRRAALAGARLIIPEDNEWPADRLAGLDTISGRSADQPPTGQPFGLWARGNGRLTDLVTRAVAVIGTRVSTSYGEHLAAQLGYELATDGITVVSGVGFGIDGAALRGAVSVPDGAAITVTACGVDLAYAAPHARLLDEVRERGLIISECPPGSPPSRRRVAARNRLIAALSSTIAVIEARERGGARHTSGIAHALGRKVFALPGPITSTASKGTHLLIQDGSAQIATSLKEIVASAPTAAPTAAPNPATSLFTPN